jgi:hypothetical protein
MKKATLLLLDLLLFTLSGCGKSDNREDFITLYNAFLARGEGVEGYEVTEIEEYDGMEFFFVRVCLNTDDAVSVDDYMWFEANVMYFSDRKDVDTAYAKNQETGLGGVCLQQGNVLIYWMENDPFADLYTDVYTKVFG